MKKTVALLLLLSLSPVFSFSETVSSALSSVSRIQQIAEELNNINNEKEIYLQELENINSASRKELIEREQELHERLNELERREQELNALKTQLALFGGLIDEQAIYYRSLSRKLTFWRIVSGILTTSLVTTLIIQGVNK